MSDISIEEELGLMLMNMRQHAAQQTNTIHRVLADVRSIFADQTEGMEIGIGGWSGRTIEFHLNNRHMASLTFVFDARVYECILWSNGQFIDRFPDLVPGDPYTYRNEDQSLYDMIMGEVRRLLQPRHSVEQQKAYAARRHRKHLRYNRNKRRVRRCA
jgi:hypothetical protein